MGSIKASGVLKVTQCCAFLLLGAVALASDGPVKVSGIAQITDGDTLTVGGLKIRLHGIDAPELSQTCRRASGLSWKCGHSSSDALKLLTANKRVDCAGKGSDAYGRLIAVCTVASKDIGAEQVRQGLAWAFLKYSDDYREDEATARVAKRGVFDGENVAPWEYRQIRWQSALRTLDADGVRECPIKGNISRNGSRIYHLPWQSTYGKTRINENAGERWFCNVEEAARAGWRPSQLP